VLIVEKVKSENMATLENNSHRINKISRTNQKQVCIEFQENRPYIALKTKEDELYFANHLGQLFLPFNILPAYNEKLFPLFSSINLFDGLLTQYIKSVTSLTTFSIFTPENAKKIGEITLRYTPEKCLNNNDSYVGIQSSSFPLYTRPDIYLGRERTKITQPEMNELCRKINAWNSEALPIIRSNNHHVIDRSSLIIQYIWSSNPLIGFPPKSVSELKLVETLEGLEKKAFPLVCGGFADLFFKIASVLMPDIKIRYANGFEAYHLTAMSDFHVNSHVFIELLYNENWVYIDPYFQLYFKNQEGKLLSSREIKSAALMKNYNDIFPSFISKSISSLFEANHKEVALEKLKLWNFFDCFNWIRCDEIEPAHPL